MNKLKYEEYIQKSPENRLKYFMDSLSTTNRTPEYYLNWHKVIYQTNKYEVELNTLNYLIGKDDIYNKALMLFEQQPNLLKAIPSLIASRDKILDVLSLNEAYDMDFYRLDFKNIDGNNIKSYVDFCKESGLLNFLQYHANCSLVDYVYGVEAGLDTNARKNRSGTFMEEIIEKNIIKVCEELNLEYHFQATSQYIKNTWNINVPVDKSKRIFDGAVYNPRNNKVWVIETNYYGGGGSKLKSVAGEFTSLSEFICSSEDNVTFVWVTDGQGWKTAQLPLLEAFTYIPNVLNLQMLKDGYLKGLFK